MTRYFVRYKSNGKETTWHGSGTRAEAERMAASLNGMKHITDVRVDSVEVK